MWQRSPLCRYRGLRSFRLGWALALAGALFALRPVDAVAKNLDLLTRLLVPGFLAQNFAALCTANNPQFLPKLPDGSASVAAFAQHLKIEITTDLTQDEAMSVLITAANTARDAARKQLNELAAAKGSDLNTSIRMWCDASARAYVLAVVEDHAKKHNAFDDIVRKAKQ